MTDIEFVDLQHCVGWSAIGWKDGPAHCTSKPQYTAGPYPCCGLHVSWVLARLVKRGLTEITVRSYEDAMRTHPSPAARETGNA